MRRKFDLILLKLQREKTSVSNDVKSFTIISMQTKYTTEVKRDWKVLCPMITFQVLLYSTRKFRL